MPDSVCLRARVCVCACAGGSVEAGARAETPQGGDGGGGGGEGGRVWNASAAHHTHTHTHNQKREDEHKKWLEQQRRALIEERVRLKIERERNESAIKAAGGAAAVAMGGGGAAAEGAYDPVEGFGVYFDFVLGLPKRSAQVQVRAGWTPPRPVPPCRLRQARACASAAADTRGGAGVAAGVRVL